MSSPSLASNGRIQSLVCLAEMFFEELPGTIQPLFREHYRLGRGCRVGDVALGVKIVQRVPVMAFPGANLIMQREIKQGKD